MNLKTLSSDELILQTEEAVKKERVSTADVVRHFQEISDRKLYLERGFPNLYEMVTRQFGYCAGSAMRRINSMRLIKEIPFAESKIESGELSLTVASDIQSLFYAEAKADRPYSVNAKIELIETCLNKSKREVEREISRRHPEREKRESIQQISAERLRVSFSISEELNVKLQKLRELLSSVDVNLSMEDLLDRLAELGLEKHDPLRAAKRAAKRKETQSSPSPEPPPAEVKVNETKPQTRYIKAEDRHELVMKYDDGLGCVFTDPVTGRRCSSKHFLERDHIEPFSYGGANTADNLQYMCAAHNKLRWHQRFENAR